MTSETSTLFEKLEASIAPKNITSLEVGNCPLQFVDGVFLEEQSGTLNAIIIDRFVVNGFLSISTRLDVSIGKCYFLHDSFVCYSVLHYWEDTHRSRVSKVDDIKVTNISKNHGICTKRPERGNVHML